MLYSVHILIAATMVNLHAFSRSGERNTVDFDGNNTSQSDKTSRPARWRRRRKLWDRKGGHAMHIPASFHAVPRSVVCFQETRILGHSLLL
jgi:hypothetical protein